MSEEQTYSRSASYSRSRRQHKTEQDVAPALNADFKSGQLPVNGWLVLGWSVLVSFLSVANPLLTGLADNLQTQNLYAGFAILGGQAPYADFFGTSGVLYYLMLALGSLFQTSLGIMVVQGLALFVAGWYFYKIIAYFSKSKETTASHVHWFYIFILGLGFGGVYSSIFVLPFLLTSLWFLIRFFEGAVRDESFLFYGIDAALVFLIDPKSALLWVVAVLVLAGYAIRKGQQARGWYQFLVGLFGFLLILYSVGYYAFVQQILGKAIQQTFLENLSLNFGSQSFFWVLITLGVFLLLTGFLKNFLKALTSLASTQHRALSIILLLTFLIQLFFIVASKDFVVSKLIVLLPYGFLMGVISLFQRSVKRPRFATDAEEMPSFSYMKSNLFLPIFVCLYAPLLLAVHYLQEGPLYQERTEVATYIQANSEATDRIYVWDTDAHIHLKSRRLGVSEFITSQPYLTGKCQQDALIFDVNQNQARYVVVNTSHPLPEGIQNNLDAHYSKVELPLGVLTLYQKK